MGVVFVGRTPMAGFRVGVSSPKRNRLDQCLLVLEESQKWVFLEGVFRVKALILKAFSVSYAASQALMPKRCKVLLEAVKELPPFGRTKMKGHGLCHDQQVSAPLVNTLRLLCKSLRVA
ncbi:hypothetical protein C4K03_1527 [Pseudomonas synxantha]|uniref:Uncharacterized protein n=1 Tax=Pseudomonas synxantha TaxID=47883 RepID=A0A3G7U4V2_9PSED|nr:hypothetical protein [Pseudomonas synxantha]AZE53698.1 hypothetical protein C4K03_1527 [Pseudomonas synxantha]